MGLGGVADGGDQLDAFVVAGAGTDAGELGADGAAFLAVDESYDDVEADADVLGADNAGSG